MKPEFNEVITEKITRITGIKTEQVKDADTFNVVFDQFLYWCGEDYEIYSWSNSDPAQLQREMKIKNTHVTPKIEYMFMHWNDLQQSFDDLFFCEQQIGLKMAVSNAGLTFRGQEHSALGDATATADIFREIKQGKSLKKINDMLNAARKPLTTNLGDLLSGIVLQIA